MKARRRVLDAHDSTPTIRTNLPCIDGSPEYVEMVASPDSPAAAVAAQQPYKIGMGAALNVARYLSGQPVPPVTFVPAVMITKANAAEVAGSFLAK